MDYSAANVALWNFIIQLGLIAGAVQGTTSEPSVFTDVRVTNSTGTLITSEGEQKTVTNFYGNNMAMKNESLVQDMNMSEACKAYMATQIEFDKSLEVLLERLEEAGVLDDTVIAIAGDHYPYGLTAEEIGEFKGHSIDEEYEMYKSTFLIWTPGLETETVDKVCGNLDILPTLLNLFGFDYDSRLLMGKDIFSESAGIVIFKDKNWITDVGTRSQLEETAPEYVKSIDKKVTNMFNYSALILDKNYYSYIQNYMNSK